MITNEIRESQQNYSFREAVHTGYLQRMVTLLDNGPARDDLENIVNTLRDLETAWQRIWQVTHPLVAAKSFASVIGVGQDLESTDLVESARHKFRESKIDYENAVREYAKFRPDLSNSFGLSILSPAYSEPLRSLVINAMERTADEELLDD